jgi:hypothetical protein
MKTHTGQIGGRQRRIRPTRNHKWRRALKRASGIGLNGERGSSSGAAISSPRARFVGSTVANPVSAASSTHCIISDPTCHLDCSCRTSTLRYARKHNQLGIDR